jgi:hypothetical protein
MLRVEPAMIGPAETVERSVVRSFRCLQADTAQSARLAAPPVPSIAAAESRCEKRFDVDGRRFPS